MRWHLRHRKFAKAVAEITPEAVEALGQAIREHHEAEAKQAEAEYALKAEIKRQNALAHGGEAA